MAFIIDDIIGEVGKTLRHIIPNKADADAAELKLREVLDRANQREHEAAMGQIEINKIEAANEHPFVSGWRPALGWVGAFGCFVAYVVLPLFSMCHAWLNQKPIPEYPIETLSILLLNMLGFAGVRTFEKLKGVAGPAVQTAEVAQVAPVPFVKFAPAKEIVQPLPEDYVGWAEELKPQADQIADPDKPTARRAIAWGQKVGDDFCRGVLWIEEQIGLNADKLMNCMAFETGETFSPSVRNLAGSSGTGLIQFMAATHRDMVARNPALKKLAPTMTALAKLTAVQQLSFVYFYFRAFGTDLSDWSQEDIYMAILYPKAIGKSPDWAMPWKYGSLAYKQNSGLDLDKNKTITKREAAAGVLKKAQKGELLKG